MRAVVGETARDEAEMQGRSKRTFTCWPLVVGLLFLGWGMFHIFLYKKFTPVYTATECGDEQATLDKFELGSDSILVGLMIEVRCINPNPYSIKILRSFPGRVFIGPQRQMEVGTMTVLPGSAMEEEGRGVVRVRMTANISGLDARIMLPHFLNDRAVPVWMELRFGVGVYISFGLRSWGASVPYSKACGLNVAGVLVGNLGTSSRLGPLECRDSFANLALPDVGEAVVDPMSPLGNSMGFSAAQVAPEEVREGELVKNVSLVSVIILSFTVGCIFIYGSFFDGPRRMSLWTDAKRREAAEDRERFGASVRALYAVFAPRRSSAAAVGGAEEREALVASADRGAAGDEEAPSLLRGGPTPAKAKQVGLATPRSPPRRDADAAAASTVVAAADASYVPSASPDASLVPSVTARASGSRTPSKNSAATSYVGGRQADSLSPSKIEESPVKEAERSSPPRPSVSAVAVRGAEGPCADVVNGVFKPWVELVGGRPAFRKDGDDDIWLCFDKAVGQNWKVQYAADKGSATGYMHSDGPTADAEVPGMATEWRVWNGDCFQAQASVTLLALPFLPSSVEVQAAVHKGTSSGFAHSDGADASEPHPEAHNDMPD